MYNLDILYIKIVIADWVWKWWDIIEILLNNIIFLSLHFLKIAINFSLTLIGKS